MFVLVANWRVVEEANLQSSSSPNRSVGCSPSAQAVSQPLTVAEVSLGLGVRIQTEKLLPVLTQLFNQHQAGICAGLVSARWAQPTIISLWLESSLISLREKKGRLATALSWQDEIRSSFLHFLCVIFCPSLICWLLLCPCVWRLQNSPTCSFSCQVAVQNKLRCLKRFTTLS